ncbi:MAG: hypothetical protein ACFFCV_10945 [Promethearchaeota archaeon]
MAPLNVNLYQQIEKILFDENNLNTLRNSISSLSKGILTSKRVKEQIIEFRLNAVKEIVKLFNFYHKQLTAANSLEEYTNSPINHNLEHELSEKNKFLQDVGNRIRITYSKLKTKLSNVD